MKSNCRKWLGVLTVGLLLTAGAPLLADWLPADCTVDAGFGGVVGPSGRLFPVAVTIENRIASTVGMIELSQPEDGGGGSEVQYVMPFDTPVNSRKRFVFLARLEPHRDQVLTIRFHDSISTYIAKLNVEKQRNPLVLCIGVPPCYKSSIPSEHYGCVTIGKEDIPSDPLALDGVHAVIIGAAAFAGLAPKQIAALREWTATGGTLIFVSPSDEDAFKRNLCLFEADPEAVSPGKGASGFGCGVMASSGPQSDGSKAFWENDHSLFNALFPAISAGHEPGAPVSSAGLFPRLWSIRRTYGGWDFFWVSIILAAYLAVVGPLDKRLTTRLRKPHLTWVFFAVAIALFTVAAYGYSRIVNVGTMRVVTVNVLDVSQKYNVVRCNALSWVYSARNATYHAAAVFDNACLSADESEGGAGKLAAGVTVENGAKATLAAKIPVFSAKQFAAAWYMPWKFNVDCYSDSPGSLTVEVPASLKVSSAYVADTNGLSLLTRAGEESNIVIMTKSAPWSWEAAIAEKVEKLDLRFGPGRYGEASDELLPSVEKLRDYMICMSFPYDPAKTGIDFWAQRYKQDRNVAEIAMDIRSRLKNARVLLLFLDDNGDDDGLRVDGGRRDIARVTLVRIPLPASF